MGQEVPPIVAPSLQASGLVFLQAELNEVLGEEQKTLESHAPVAQVDL